MGEQGGWVAPLGACAALHCLPWLTVHVMRRVQAAALLIIVAC